MEFGKLRTALAVSLLFGTAVAGAAVTTEATSAPDMWTGYNGTKGKKAPTMQAVAAPNDTKGVEVSAVDDGKWQGIRCVFAAPLKLEAGDVLKFYARQTAAPNARSITLNAVFSSGQFYINTPAVGGDWTEVTLALDPAKWTPAGKKARPAEFGALEQFSLYPADNMDTVGETLAVAGLQVLKADGSARSIKLADSLVPTEEEAKWMDVANWKGFLGSKDTNIPPKVEAMDTPNGKAVVVRPQAKGAYQGIEFFLPAPLDLKKYKAVVFDVYPNTGNPASGCYLWLNYASGSAVHCAIGPWGKDGAWHSVKVVLDYDKLQSYSSVSGPGMLASIRMTRYGNLDAPGKELAMRNIHFIPKDEEDLAREAEEAKEADEW